MSTPELEIPANWQAMLRELITDTKMRTKLAAVIHVRPVTLQRWGEGTCKPRIDNLRALLRHLPSELYPLFMRLLLVDFPELLRDEVAEVRISESIPSEF